MMLHRNMEENAGTTIDPFMGTVDAIPIDEWLKMKRKPAKKVVAYSGTRNFYRRMSAAIKSLLSHTAIDHVYVLIEDDVFPYWLPECVTCINIKDQKLIEVNSHNNKSPFTYMAMIRSVYCYLFPELDTILSLDVDTFVEDDISGIWDLPIEDCYFAASREPTLSEMTKMDYTNFGVILYNLEKMRGIVDEAVEQMETKTFFFLEQDCLNAMCQGHICFLPTMYNSNPYVEKAERVVIKHYAGVKDWTYTEEYKRYDKMSWKDICG